MPPKAKMPTRPYIYTDPKAIEICGVAHRLLTEDLNLFTNFDSNINAQFLLDWQAAIDASSGFKTNETFEDQLQGLSTARNKAMRTAIKSYNWLMHFVRKAYEGNEGMLTEFGKGQLAKVRYSPSKLYSFILQMHGTGTEYMSTLSAAAIGYKAAHHALMLTHAQDLLAAQTAFLNKKREQKTTTTERINALRAMWQFQTQVNKVAKIIFSDNYGKYQQYLLPKHKSGEKDG